MNSKKYKMEKLKNARPPDFGEKQYNRMMECKEVKLWNLFYGKLVNLSQNQSKMEKQDFINNYNDWNMKKEFLWKHLLKSNKELRVIYESSKNELEKDKMDTDSLDKWMKLSDRMMDDMEENLILINKRYLNNSKSLEIDQRFRKNCERLSENNHKFRKNIDLLSENYQRICTQDFLDDEEYATDFTSRKPRESVVLKVEVAVQEIIEENEKLEVLKVENYPIIQILQIQDEYIDEEIGDELTDLHFQNDGQKIVTTDVEPNIKYLIEKMDEDNENLTYDFTFLKLEGRNPLNDGRIMSGQFGYISDENMSSPKNFTSEVIMLSFWNKTRSVTKVLGKANCRKYLLPKLRLIFDRGKEIWSFPTSILRGKHEKDLQIINYPCNIYGLVIEIFLLLI